MRPLNRETLIGLWAAVPTPWDRHGKLDEGILARNCERLADARVDGIYTTDSDGEFYAIELDQFAVLARAFAKAMERIGLDAAIGVTWTHTQGIIDRLKISCDVGIPNVHVGFPFFMPLADSDVDRFWDALARAVPDGRWIHYAHPNCGPALTGAEYARLAQRYPDNFIGTKLSERDVIRLTEILMRSTELAHLITDPIMAPGMMLGARGCCSYWVNTMPRWHRRYMDACLAGDWAAAVGYHKRLLEWELIHIKPLRDAGHNHGILGKARGALTHFLEETGITQPPYAPISDAHQQQLQAAFDRYWAADTAYEPFARSLTLCPEKQASAQGRSSPPDRQSNGTPPV
jgi:4-hydroxy-tetrahydrodipicolinate synthase